MNQKQKEEILDLFAQAFHEVVVPVLEGMGIQINKLDEKVEKIDRRLITVTDHQADKLDDHEKRIGKIETSINN